MTLCSREEYLEMVYGPKFWDIVHAYAQDGKSLVEMFAIYQEKYDREWEKLQILLAKENDKRKNQDKSISRDSITED